jgi:hypothetical protein
MDGIEEGDAPQQQAAAAAELLPSPAGANAAPPSSLAIYLDALCMREYLCSFAQLPRAMRPRLVQLAMLDMSACLWA